MIRDRNALRLASIANDADEVASLERDIPDTPADCDLLSDCGYRRGYDQYGGD